MSAEEHDKHFHQAVMARNVDGAKAALEAGASVNGRPEEPFPPIAIATIFDHVGMVELFLREGADPDRPVTTDQLSPTSGKLLVGGGERALYIAARCSRIDIVGVLLNQSRADPNATDNRGRTPLLESCQHADVCVEVVQLLLEAGADPTIADKHGHIPLHMVAAQSNMELFDMVYSSAPDMLNHCTFDGKTVLFAACCKGSESAVSKLLSLGAMQPVSSNTMLTCPLLAAVEHGFTGVVRVLVNEGGMRAVGGEIALRMALYVAVYHRRPKILQLLLTADEKRGRSKLANSIVQDTPLLHYSTIHCYPAAVSILLEAGADAAMRDSEGFLPRDVIGACLVEVQTDLVKTVAIERMLQRGPAFRARSWAWPTDLKADACCTDDSDTPAAAAAAAVVSCLQVGNLPTLTGVRIGKLKNNYSRSKCFVRIIGRYCAKN